MTRHSNAHRDEVIDCPEELAERRARATAMTAIGLSLGVRTSP